MVDPRTIYYCAVVALVLLIGGLFGSSIVMWVRRPREKRPPSPHDKSWQEGTARLLQIALDHRRGGHDQENVYDQEADFVLSEEEEPRGGTGHAIGRPARPIPARPSELSRPCDSSERASSALEPLEVIAPTTRTLDRSPSERVAAADDGESLATRRGPRGPEQQVRLATFEVSEVSRRSDEIPDSDTFTGSTSRSRLQLSTSVQTSAGRRRRSNDDAAQATPYLLALADGVGSTVGGGEAARIAVHAVQRVTDGRPRNRAQLEEAAHYAHAEVRLRARREPVLAGMAATLDLVCLADDGDGQLALHGLHIGDGAVWLLRGNEELKLLTQPHVSADGRLMQMVGYLDRVRFDPWTEPVRAGDRVFVASDGLWADVDKASVEALLWGTRALSPKDQAHVLHDVAMRAGGSDNITVIVAAIEVSSGARQQPDPSGVLQLPSPTPVR